MRSFSFHLILKFWLNRVDVSLVLEMSTKLFGSSFAWNKCHLFRSISFISESHPIKSLKYGRRGFINVVAIIYLYIIGLGDLTERGYRCVPGPREIDYRGRWTRYISGVPRRISGRKWKAVHGIQLMPAGRRTVRSINQPPLAARLTRRDINGFLTGAVLEFTSGYSNNGYGRIRAQLWQRMLSVLVGNCSVFFDIANYFFSF